jgi:hypothetical protein
MTAYLKNHLNKDITFQFAYNKKENEEKVIQILDFFNFHIYLWIYLPKKIIHLKKLHLKLLRIWHFMLDYVKRRG